MRHRHSPCVRGRGTLRPRGRGGGPWHPAPSWKLGGHVGPGTGVGVPRVRSLDARPGLKARVGEQPPRSGSVTRPWGPWQDWGPHHLSGSPQRQLGARLAVGQAAFRDEEGEVTEAGSSTLNLGGAGILLLLQGDSALRASGRVTPAVKAGSSAVLRHALVQRWAPSMERSPGPGPSEGFCPRETHRGPRLLAGHTQPHASGPGSPAAGQRRFDQRLQA